MQILHTMKRFTILLVAAFAALTALAKPKTDAYLMVYFSDNDHCPIHIKTCMSFQRAGCRPPGTPLLNLEGRNWPGQGATAVEGILGRSPRRIRSEGLQGHSPGG